MNILDGTRRGGIPKSETKYLLKLPLTDVRTVHPTRNPPRTQHTDSRRIGTAGLRGWGWNQQATLFDQIEAWRQGSLGRRRGPFTCVRGKKHSAQVECDVEWTHVFSPRRERRSTGEDAHVKSGSVSTSFPVVVKRPARYSNRSRLLFLFCIQATSQRQ